MAISIGDSLPAATFLEIGEAGPGPVTLASLAGSGRMVLFGVPGAYTSTCSSAHVPSFIRTMDQLKAKGVETVCCVAVNDPFVMQAWGETTGAIAAGIRMLADPDASFTKAIGLSFSAPPVGFIDRSQRYSMLVEDGRVTQLNVEAGPGSCEISAGETLVSQI